MSPIRLILLSLMAKLYGRDNNNSSGQLLFGAHYVPITVIRALHGWFCFKSFNIKFLYFTNVEIETQRV